jgi:hypothetical protein
MMCVCEGELGKFKECDEFYLNDNDLCGVIPPQVQALSSQPSMSFYEIYNNPGLGTPCVWEPSFVPTMSFAPTHAPTAKKQSSGSGNSFFTSAGFLVGANQTPSVAAWYVTPENLSRSVAMFFSWYPISETSVVPWLNSGFC